jgi:hypothetical protein
MSLGIVENHELLLESAGNTPTAPASPFRPWKRTLDGPAWAAEGCSMNPKMLVAVAVLSLLCGFGGATLGVAVFAGEIRGEQGEPGARGSPGDRGPRGRPGPEGAGLSEVRGGLLLPGVSGCPPGTLPAPGRRVVTGVTLPFVVPTPQLSVDYDNLCEIP